MLLLAQPETGSENFFFRSRAAAVIETVEMTRNRSLREKTFMITLAANGVATLKHLIIAEVKEVREKMFSSLTFMLYRISKKYSSITTTMTGIQYRMTVLFEKN